MSVPAATLEACEAIARGRLLPDGPGIAYAVVHAGETVARGWHGLAVVEHDVAIGPDTGFYLCSLAKQLTAYVVVSLSTDGTLDLDDDPRRWLPGLPADPAGLTLRHLLHHTSGLRDYLALQALAGEEFEDGIDRDDVLAMLARQRHTEHAPGERYAYGNSGYLALATICERATGTRWPDLLREHVFEPAGMTGAHALRSGDVVPRQATGYSRDRRRLRKRALRHVVPGPGGVVATLDDMIAWEAVLAGRRGDPVRRAALLVPGTLADGSPVAYAGGLTLGSFRGRGAIGHGGGFPGWSTWITHLPDDDLTAIVLANDDGIPAGIVAEELLDAVLGSRPDPTSPPPVGAPAGTTPPVPGRYINLDLNDAFDVRVTDAGPEAGRQGTWVPLVEGADGSWATPGAESLRFAPDGVVDVLRNGRPFASYRRAERVDQTPAEFVGTYLCPELGLLIDIVERSGSLALERGHRPPVALMAVGADAFFAAFGIVRFHRDAAGAVASASIDSMQVHGIEMTRCP